MERKGKMLQLISSISPIQLVTTAIFGYWILWIFYARFFHPLRSVPGPFLASISRAWIVDKTGRGDMEYTQRALHKKYGMLIRTASDGGLNCFTQYFLSFLGYLVRIAPNEIPTRMRSR